MLTLEEKKAGVKEVMATIANDIRRSVEGKRTFLLSDRI
jgi:hypothetical protein